MPALEAIYYTGTQAAIPYNLGGTNGNYRRGRTAYLAISGVTPGVNYQSVLSGGGTSQINGFYYPAYPQSAITVGSVTASQAFVMVPADLALNGQANYFNVITFSVLGSNFSTQVTVSRNDSNPSIGEWTVTQNSEKNVIVSCSTFGPGEQNKIFYAYDNLNTNVFNPVPAVWKITLQNDFGETIVSQDVKPSVTTMYPMTTFSSNHVTTTGLYNVLIQKRIITVDETDFFLNHIITTTLTAPAVTSGGGGNMFSWLNNDYWYLTDLQVNLGTRAVTHRHGTVQIKPNDTINFAVFFHNGSAGVNPVATDLRLAVRSSSNASAYHFWSAATVTTASVSGDVYYAITVTASDEDLLAAQAAGLLAGSNTSQSLLAEVQWTTTRGTFSSDTFTIEVPNEVVRDPDV